MLHDGLDACGDDATAARPIACEALRHRLRDLIADALPGAVYLRFAGVYPGGDLLHPRLSLRKRRGATSEAAKAGWPEATKKRARRGAVEACAILEPAATIARNVDAWRSHAAVTPLAAP